MLYARQVVMGKCLTLAGDIMILLRRVVHTSLPRDIFISLFVFTLTSLLFLLLFFLMLKV